MSDYDMIRRGDAYGEFPEDWRDRAHGVKGTLKMQAAWSDGFNACRKSIAALPAVDVAQVRAVTPAMVEAYITAISTNMTGDLRVDVARGLVAALAKQGEQP
jgi:hypothetical protein